MHDESGVKGPETYAKPTARTASSTLQQARSTKGGFKADTINSAQALADRDKLNHDFSSVRLICSHQLRSPS